MNSEERKEEILEKSLEIIYNEGFGNLTMRNIAEKIGISEAAIYRHFKNKEEVVSSLADIVFNENRFWNIEIGDKDPFTLLEEIMFKQLEILKENPYLTAILFQDGIFGEYPEIKEKFISNRKKNEEKIRDIIIKGQEKGVISTEVDPGVIAVFYMGSFRLIVLKWRDSGFSYSPLKEAGKIIRQLTSLIS